MKVVILDDYQDAVRTLPCFALLQGHAVRVFNDSTQDLDVLAARLAGAEALVLIRERTPISAALLDRLPDLRLISQTGRGIAHIDLKACSRRGVAVAVGSGSPHSTAELTWALLLAAMRQLPQEVARLKAGQWQGSLGTGLRGRTLGLFGFGNIGRVVAGYGQAFGMRVLVWGRDSTLARAREQGFETAPSQQALFEQADALSLHLRLVEQTRGIIGAGDLACMQPGAVLVNTSRAELIEPGALLAALQAGRPGRAAVDVYEEEPAPDHPLLRLDNVICTPHLGYVEQDSYQLYFTAAFEHLLAFAAGAPCNLVNPEVLGA
ncbi:D-2-hydroxyacid dehydrogenase family protein [Pseudomonas benzenivorans]|uniref:D-2-hydroxyacid dehydrogenase family protein n=1 Tax=Pseudomonas benzenivorans TaxID=556533 RepID=A0ABY5HAH9_9PSED|nr:D-2-hydroxyacid dehydrogenase family protein [Pseudomonas benzenivorans]UTW09345.1 D-2-hydroxyacid dehydrogenase family protein [Pseudomonas benzenivorans]